MYGVRWSLLIGRELYRERSAYLILIRDSGLTYLLYISLLVNSGKWTVQLTEHTGRELSSPLLIKMEKNDNDKNMQGTT